MRVVVKDYDEYVEVKTEDKRAAETSCWPKLVGCGRSYKCTGRVMTAGQPTVLTFGFIESPGAYQVVYEPL